MDKNSGKIKKSNKTEKNETPLSESSEQIQNTKPAEEKIQQYVILNAWRHQKEKNKKLEVDVKNLSTQVESLQLQIYALKHLLDGEKNRVVHFNSDLRKILTVLEECKHEKHSLEKEKEQLELRLHVLEEKLGKMETECKNQRNELVTVKNEAQNWEKQLEKEREKLSKMKDERKFFIEEVRLKGNQLVCQIRSFEQFARLFNNLQTKSNSPALPWDKLLERNESKPEKQKNLRKQRTLQIQEKPPESPELKLTRRKPERKTPEEDEKIEELEKSISGKTEKSSLIPYFGPDVTHKF